MTAKPMIMEQNLAKNNPFSCLVDISTGPCVEKGMLLVPVQSSHKIKFTILFVLVTALSIVFGVMLDDDFMPKDKQILSIVEDENSHKDGTNGAVELSQTSEIVAVKQKKQQQFAKMKELDRKAVALMEKAEDITRRADLLVFEAEFQKITTGKKVAQDNKKITTRLADLRSRLNAMKK